MKRKSSLNISLLFWGVGITAGVIACDGTEENRPVYRTRQDCLNDWKTEEQCNEIVGGARHGYYYGPRMTYIPHGSRSLGIESVRRGGFGHSFFHSLSSGS